MKKQKKLFSLKKAICFLLVLSLMLLPLSAFAGETGAGSGRTKEAFRFRLSRLQTWLRRLSAAILHTFSRFIIFIL